eukprot:GSMAST32.ASY1.ANO1.108.1 assembled CDS
MNLMECDFGRRLVVATIGGAIIGFERRLADRPAGIRTMSLTALGAAIFTLCSTWAFMAGPQKWDASRISAAIPSGVGFLGAGLIWKGTTKDEEHHTVHGLTTAASLWISASVGISCGGGLYSAGAIGVALTLMILRYGPRLYLGQFEDDRMEHFEDGEENLYDFDADDGDIPDDNKDGEWLSGNHTVLPVSEEESTKMSSKGGKEILRESIGRRRLSMNNMRHGVRNGGIRRDTGHWVDANDFFATHDSATANTTRRESRKSQPRRSMSIGGEGDFLSNQPRRRRRLSRRTSLLNRPDHAHVFCADT